jgi:hypothetical protein
MLPIELLNKLTDVPPEDDDGMFYLDPDEIEYIVELVEKDMLDATA